LKNSHSCKRERERDKTDSLIPFSDGIIGNCSLYHISLSNVLSRQISDL
jgi:hypothetical protein